MADLINFKLSKKASDVADLLVSSGLFGNALDVAKFGSSICSQPPL